ncbi:MAG: cytochrome D1 domain-containing protein [Gemmatimonadales bacterium]
MRKRALLALILAGLVARTAGAQAFDYRLAVVSESGDIVTWVRPGPGSLTVDRVVPVGIMPADIDGPHNITVSPDNRFYYVSIAHGTPYGSLWKMAVDGDTLVGRAPLEIFPTTISVTPDGELAFVANSDFYGDHPRLNFVSIVHTPSMTTVTNLAACDMPHGVKANHAGTRVYVSCMHSDELLVIDTGTLAISRRVRTGSGMPVAGGHAAHDSMAPAEPLPDGLDQECSPTFVSVSPDDQRLYVACNHASTLQVWDAWTLTLVKQIPVGPGAYNVEPSPDGSVVIVTNKKAQSVSLVDVASLTEVARIPTTKKIVHGVAYSPDGRYAYISCESIGANPGAVDMIDLATRTIIATLPIPSQPTGITVWRPVESTQPVNGGQ